MYDLETTSTADLLNEIASRYDHVIFAGIKARPTAEDPGNMIRSWRYKGNAQMCQGLAFTVAYHAQRGSDETEEIIPSDEL